MKDIAFVDTVYREVGHHPDRAIGAELACFEKRKLVSFRSCARPNEDGCSTPLLRSRWVRHGARRGLWQD